MTAQSLTIKMAVADPALTGVTDPGSHIVYTIDIVPTLGTLTVNGVAVTDGGQITQDQFDQGLVVYTDDGSGAGSDLFGYSISDPLLNHNLGSGSFNTHHNGGVLVTGQNVYTGGSDPVIFFSEPGNNNSITGTTVTVSYALAPAGVFISLPIDANNGFGGFDNFGNISSVIGSSHDDTIFSSAGDVIFGGGGDDKILGVGSETAGFSGARSDYFALFVNSDEVKITDLRPGSPDGTDDLPGVHSFQFSDGTYSLAQLNALSEVENSGSTILGYVGDNYFLFTNGTAGEPELKFQGSPVSVTHSNLFAVGAEQVAGGGYEVAWESFSNPSGTPMFQVWNVDSNGNYVSTLLGPVVASDQVLEALESSTFSQDLNNDGIIGVPNVTAIETFGSTELGQASTFYYMDPVAGGTGPELKYTGAPYVAGAWVPIGAEKTSTGYEVALFNASSNLYTIWNTDSSGNVLSASLAGVSGTNTSLEFIETSFHQDLNGDHTIGIPGVIESFGATELTEVGNNYFFDPIAGGSGPELKYGGSPFVAGAWAPIGVEKTAAGFEVALFNASSNLYTIWNTDSSGNVLSASLAGVSGTNTALESIEVSFHQDLNGDNNIGIPGVIETSGATELVVVGNDFFFNPVAGGTGPELKYGGSPFVAGAWVPIGAEHTATGYEVALFNAASNLYTIWNTDSTGNVLSASLAGVAGTNTALESIEGSFHQDLNGDGVIGIPGIIETFGATELAEVGNNYFFNPVAGGTGPELKYGGSPFVATAWAPIGVEKISSGYEVALFNASSQLYSVWNTDSSGNVVSSPIAGVSGTNTALESIETSFQQDLNGDNVIGPPSHTSAVVSVLNNSTAGMATIAAPPSIIAPSAGNAVLSGSAAADTFVFNAHFGNDTVTGFQPGVDQVNLDHTLAASIADLFTHTADNAHGSAVVTIGADQSITFDHVSTQVLQQHASDFHLV